MASPTGFLQFSRIEVGHRPVQERIRDWYEIDRPLVEKNLNEQAARCMDCGIPFCHGAGCPVKNRIPEFNDLVYRGRWREAAENLHSTNNFPEVTGRVCPAPCEAACTLAINDDPVNIKHIEFQIAQRAFKEGWIKPVRPARRTGKRVAVVGSGPAGLAAAQQLTRAGHEVVVFEKDDRLGGLLRYGIPDFKMQKQILDRRLEQMVAEGAKFEPGVNVGADVSGRYLRKIFDAVCLAMGAGQPRPLDVPGADLKGVHYAMEFLPQQNRRVAGDSVASLSQPEILATDKHVIVVGGGDTGSDCVGTSIRQGARSVTQLEILPKPPETKNPQTPWPMWPAIMRTSSSHEEGCHRRWSVLTKALSGADGCVTHLHACEVDWIRGEKGWQMQERPASDFTLRADLVLLAMGFLHVVHKGLVEQLGVETNGRGNVVVRDWMTTGDGIFAAGDTVRGASLVVHAINEGRLAARAIDRWLHNGESARG
ncbi:MAG: glutamate synthase subunit beta [Pirellulales bacterium]|nr:glutamate synthase subunit beta [Pirellulales bacterium]